MREGMILAHDLIDLAGIVNLLQREQRTAMTSTPVLDGNLTEVDIAIGQATKTILTQERLLTTNVIPKLAVTDDAVAPVEIPCVAATKKNLEGMNLLPAITTWTRIKKGAGRYVLINYLS